MKKIITVTLCIVLVLLFAGCGKNGDTSKVEIDYGASSIYSKEEIDSAIEIIKKQFALFEGCELHRLSYMTDDELKRSEGDNPTIGIVLCSDTDDDIARYSVMHGNEQLFASKYKLYLPTKEELKAEIETQKAMFYLQQQDNEDRNKNYTFNIE